MFLNKSMGHQVCSKLYLEQLVNQEIALPSAVVILAKLLNVENWVLFCFKVSFLYKTFESLSINIVFFQNTFP